MLCLFRSLAAKAAFVLVIPVMACSFYGTALAADDAEKKLINPNTASVEMLSNLPGMDRDLAMEVVAFREMMGDLQSTEELLQVKGFNEGLLKRIQPFISVDPMATDCGC